MKSLKKRKDTKLPTRRIIVFSCLFVIGALIGGFFGTDFFSEESTPRTEEVAVHESHTGDVSAETLDASQPISLSIPSISLETEFEAPLGLNADRSVEVPDSFKKVGWYEYSPTPGELGPSVVLGHVDSYEGPAVFFSIGQLEQGDPIEITREDGSVATFRVTGIRRYEQEGFPTELVYGDIDYAGLRLVTCSGTYDSGAQKYSHNTVVYAKLDASSER